MIQALKINYLMGMFFITAMDCDNVMEVIFITGVFLILIFFESIFSKINIEFLTTGKSLGGIPINLILNKICKSKTPHQKLLIIYRKSSIQKPRLINIPIYLIYGSLICYIFVSVILKGFMEINIYP